MQLFFPVTTADSNIDVKAQKTNVTKNTTQCLCLIIIALMFFVLHNNAFCQESSINQNIKEFFSETLDIAITSIIGTPCISYDVVGLPHKTFIADKTYRIQASIDGSSIYSVQLTKDLVPKEDIEGKTNKDAISDDAAFSAVIPLLEYYDLPVNKSEYQIDFIDINGENEDDLYGCSWSISYYLKLNGIPCRTRFVNISVSAAAKVIEGFIFRPVISPENTLDNAITYASARQLALDWILEQPYLTGEGLPTLTGDNNNGIQVIAPEYNILVPNESEATEQPKTYYCWEVPFTYKEFDYTPEAVVWVDIQTGEIVGGGEKEE